MQSKDRGTRGHGNVAEKPLEEALAALIASTRRVRRKLSLLEVAERLEMARRGLGGLKAVSERIGISVEMLRQFATIGSLAPVVRRLIAQRKIDGVDVAHRLTKLAPSEQVTVARAFVTGKLDSDDIRAVVSLRRAAPRLSIGKVIERVRGSRTIKEYLALFLVPGDGRDVTQLRSRFAHVVGDGNIRSLRLEGPLGILAVSAEGRRRLAEEAKAASLTKKKLIERIVARSA